MIEVNAIGNRDIDYSRVTKYVDQDTYNTWFRKHLAPEDILFSTVGATALCSFYNGTNTSVIAQNIVGLRFKDIHKAFAYYLLTEPRNNHKFKRIQMSGVQPSVKVSQMIHLYFDVPEAAEQQKIADFLGSVDAWLDNLRQQKTVLETYKQGMTQKIFTQQVRFKDENENDYTKWEEKRLGEIAKSVKGKGLSKEDIRKGGSYKCIRYAELYTNYEEVITDIVSETDIGPTGMVLSKRGDLLFPSSGETAEDIARFSSLTEEGVILSGDLNAIRFSEAACSPFFAYYLSNHLNAEIAKFAQGNSVVHLYWSHFNKLTFKIPCFDEQVKIADFLIDIDKTIIAKSEEIMNVEQWKKGLMQKMFV